VAPADAVGLVEDDVGRAVPRSGEAAEDLGADPGAGVQVDDGLQDDVRTSVALGGTVAIPGGAPTVAGNDSVLRFYAVWWAVRGPAAWSSARDPVLDERRVRMLCVTTFLGGLARPAAMRTSKQAAPVVPCADRRRARRPSGPAHRAAAPGARLTRDPMGTGVAVV
jgi:hypothetical protein